MKQLKSTQNVRDSKDMPVSYTSNLFKEYPFGAALKLSLSWHLLSRISFIIPNKHFLIKYYGGKMYINLREGRNETLGVYEYWKTRLFMDLIKHDMTAIDVGASKGYYSLLMAKLMNDHGKVFSFEPDPTNCYWIKKSIKANNYKSIKLFPIALSDNNGSATFYLGKHSGWGSLLFSAPASAPDKKPITVKTRKLDDILEEEGVDSIDVIKVDVEGADLKVLKGAERTLKRNENIKLIMDIDVKSEEEKKQLFEILSSWDFKVYNIGKQLKPLNKIDEAGRDIFATKTK